MQVLLRADDAAMIKPLNILFVDDSRDDTFFAKVAFEKAGFLANIDAVVDGVEALAYIRNESQNDQALDIDMILLDLNMPRMDGKEFLQKIKSDDAHSHIPVIVMTTSDDDLDIEACYKLQASTYVVKPIDLKKFIDAVQRIKDYWIGVARLPRPA